MPLQPSLPSVLSAHIAQAIAVAGGWLPFDEFMQMALYTPTEGYYTSGRQKLGLMPPRPAQPATVATPATATAAAVPAAPGRQATEGSDFVTAPELSPIFGACLADQIAQALEATGTHAVYEFGAGTGALALQILEQLNQQTRRPVQYFIVDISGELRARQAERLQRFGGQVAWLNALPAQIEGVLLGNEVLDAMPVKLLARSAGVWHERGVSMAAGVVAGVATGVAAAAVADASEPFCWQDRPTALRPPLPIAGAHDYLTEIHPQAEAFIATLAAHLQRGAMFFVDYGFSESEYYHPQRHMGTLMCHYQHQADTNPLLGVGRKDITAHINFSGIALAGQDAGLDVLGYANQGRFLMNCGALPRMEALPVLARGQAAKLVTEHEMGELFKVIAFGKNADWQPLGFALGDKTHTL